MRQTKYSGYTVRSGLAITMEHNFMMSPQGRQVFKNKLQQVVGSIQYTNDIDVHMALIQAPSYAKEKAEETFMNAKTNHQIIREYIDLFGMMQKNNNALDIIIEEAKAVLRTWGAKEPTFLLCNSKMTFQLQMTPEKTQYLTQGPEGTKRLKQGPNISSYRGLNIINSRSFSLEDGAPPRDVLRRRVRVAEYYRIPWEPGVEKKYFSFYDESKDTWHKFSWYDLFRMAEVPERDGPYTGDDNDYDEGVKHLVTKLPGTPGGFPYAPPETMEAIKFDGAQNLDAKPNYRIDAEYYENEMNVENVADNPIVALIRLMPQDNAKSDLRNKYGLNSKFMEAPTAAEMLREGETIWENNYQGFAQDFKDFIVGNIAHMVPAKRKWFTDINWTATQNLVQYINAVFPRSGLAQNHVHVIPASRYELVIVRPCIEHNMLGVVIGRGGLELGATFWGQTELSCADDGQHGIWQMSYKYNERYVFGSECLNS